VHDRVTVLSDLAGHLRRNLLVVAASSTGGLLDARLLRPGSVVDVVSPRDVIAPVSGRDDVLVLDALAARIVS
jgi:predicted amino acid dehydrogenase